VSASPAQNGLPMVLVADGEEATQQELRTLLERGAYRVITAGDGAAIEAESELTIEADRTAEILVLDLA